MSSQKPKKLKKQSSVYDPNAEEHTALSRFNAPASELGGQKSGIIQKQST